MTYTTYDIPPDKPDDKRRPNPALVPYKPDDSGAYRNRRYQQIFEDHTDFGLGYPGPEPDKHRVFEDSLGSLGAETGPYEDSIFLIHSNRRGVRVSIQAPRKIFFAALIIVVVILTRPGLIDGIEQLLRSLQAVH